MNRARIENGVVAEIITDSKAVFHPDIMATLTACPPETTEGWAYDGTSFTAPAGPSVADYKKTLKAQANAVCDNRIAGEPLNLTAGKQRAADLGKYELLVPGFASAMDQFIDATVAESNVYQVAVFDAANDTIAKLDAIAKPVWPPIPAILLS